MAVAALGTVLGAGGLGFGLWATLTTNPVLFGRQTALAGIYSLVLAALVAAVAMTAWGWHRGQGRPAASTARAGAAPAGDEPRHSSEVQVVVGDIPQKPAGFQPRADLLEELDAPLAGRSVSVVYAVTGMRGVGKTQLAGALARARLAEGWRLVAWINAKDVAGLHGGLAAVAAKLGLAGTTADSASAGMAVRHWLEADGRRCLLVFDNAADPDALRAFIPAGGDAQVLITSNEQAIRNLGGSVPVDVFTEEEALNFLAERTGQADSNGARSLAAELDLLPLALAQAAAVMAAQHLDYATYLRRLRDTRVDELLAPVAAGQYPRHLAEAVLLSLDAACGKDDTGVSGAVMNFVSLLSAAGVTRTLVHTAGQSGSLTGDKRAGVVPADVVDEALGRLAGASLLTFSLDGGSVTAHRLVMRVVRERLTGEGHLVEACRAVAKTLDAQAKSLRQAWQDRTARRDLVGQIRDLVEQIMILYEHSASAHSDADTGLTHAVLRIRLSALRFLNELGDSATQAISVGEPLVADMEHILGPDDPDTLTSRKELANAYLAAGRAAEAIPLHRGTLADRERILGPDHPDTLASRNNLANAYLAAGRGREAIPLYERTLTDMERILGPDDPDTLTSRNNLANAYQTAERPAEAIPLHERTLADRERILGHDHPSTLTSRYNLGNAYQAAGRAREAIPLYERTLTDLERILGHDHPSTIETRNHLANANRDEGRAQ